MAKLVIERTDFHNPTPQTIVFDLGTSPNQYPERITVLPGETHKGFAGYKKFYGRKGLKPGAAPSVSSVQAEAVEAAAAAAKALEDANASKEEAEAKKAQALAVNAEATLLVAEANMAKADAIRTAAAPLSASVPSIEPVTAKKAKVAPKKASKG